MPKAREPRSPIPPEVLRELRKEVGLICPVEGCDSPYLTWHHFDPPYREGQTHDPKGMIALCQPHHDRADGGAYSKAELRAMKSLQREERPAGDFDFKLPQLVLFAGGSLFTRTPNLLAFRNQTAIWLSGDDQGRQLLNFDIRDRTGTLVFSMRDNAWQVIADIDDLECPPSAKSLLLRAPSLGVRLSVALNRRSAGELLHILERFLRDRAKRSSSPPSSVHQYIGAQASEESSPNWRDEAERLLAEISDHGEIDEFAVCELEAKLPWPRRVHLTETRINVDDQSTVTGAIFLRCGTAIYIGERPPVTATRTGLKRGLSSPQRRRKNARRG